MHAIDQHDAEVLWRQLQISDDSPNLGAWRIFTIFPLESSGPKESDQFDVNFHSLWPRDRQNSRAHQKHHPFKGHLLPSVRIIADKTVMETNVFLVSRIMSSAIPKLEQEEMKRRDLAIMSGRTRRCH